MKALFLCGAMLYGMTTALAEDAMKATDNLLPNMRGKSRAQTEQSANHFIDAFERVGANLASQAEDAAVSLEGRAYVLFLLGEIRSTQAIPLLIKHIDCDAKELMRFSALQRFGRYPAQVALVRIGLPAVEEIVKVLPVEVNENRKRLMLIAVRQVLSPQTGLHYIVESLSQRIDLPEVTRRSLIDGYRSVNLLNEQGVPISQKQ